MGEGASDPNRRKLAVMLSALALTPDDALEIFRDRRAADRSLDPQDLRRARIILDAIGHAILDRDADRWRRIREASRLVERDAARAPVGDDDATQPPPEPAQPAAPPQPAQPAAPPQPAQPAAPPQPAQPAAPPLRPLPVPPAPVSAPAPWTSATPAPGPAPPARAQPADGETAPSGSALGRTLPPYANVQQIFAGLPFKKSGPEAPPAPSLGADEERGDVGATQLLRKPYRTIRVLPFDSKDDHKLEVAARSVAQPPASSAVPVEPPSQPRHAQAGAEPSMDPPLVQLTLEQYAAFCAERTVYPAQIADVLARYQLRDEPQAKRLDQLWHARFEADRSLGERYAKAYEHYCQWHRKQHR